MDSFGIRRWTPEETEVLKRLRAEGKTFEQIGLLMGRSKAGCKERFRWINITQERRETRNLRSFLARNGKVDPLRLRRQRTPIADTMPANVFTDRQERNSAPRTLTAIFCGDPAPGWSALDRKSEQRPCP